jgi:hypothetical protein
MDESQQIAKQANAPTTKTQSICLPGIKGLVQSAIQTTHLAQLDSIRLSIQTLLVSFSPPRPTDIEKVPHKSVLGYRLTENYRHSLELVGNALLQQVADWNEQAVPVCVSSVVLRQLKAVIDCTQKDIMAYTTGPLPDIKNSELLLIPYWNIKKVFLYQFKVYLTWWKRHMENLATDFQYYIDQIEAGNSVPCLLYEPLPSVRSYIPLVLLSSNNSSFCKRPLSQNASTIEDAPRPKPPREQPVSESKQSYTDQETAEPKAARSCKPKPTSKDLEKSVKSSAQVECGKCGLILQKSSMAKHRKRKRCLDSHSYLPRAKRTSSIESDG